MTLPQVIALILQASIVMTVFGFGLQAKLADILDLTRRPWLLVRSLGAMFLVMPLVAVALAAMLDLRPSVKIVMVALSISPLPPLLPGKQTKAGGHGSYAIGLMAIVSLLSIVVVPVGMQILARYFGQPLHMSAGAVARVVLITALLPLAVGMGVRAFLPGVAARVANPIALVAGVLLVCGVLALVAASLPATLVLIGNATVLAIAAFVAVGLAVGHLAGGSRRDEQIVLALSTASRHPAIALAIAKENFPGEPSLGAAVLLFLMVGGLVGAPYLAWQRRRAQDALPAEAAAR